MKSQGWHKLRVVLFLAGLFFSGLETHGAPLGVRDIRVEDGARATILLDGNSPKGSIQIEYVRDIVQFTLQNSTIYPARILHSDAGDNHLFSKIFAYQYAPNVVRVRFTVDGQAEGFKGRVKFEINGKEVRIQFSPAVEQARNLNAEKEQSLLSKVLSGTSEATSEKKIKEPRTPSLQKQVELGGKTHGPSVMRSLFAMFLVVGGLGLVLIFLKRKAGTVQAKRMGQGWLANLVGGGKKRDAVIEVLGNHSIGPKQSITIVRIKDQQFVLGVTPDSVQLITQLDSDEADFEVLGDPKVADSIGKIFGSKVISEQKSRRQPSLAEESTAPIQASEFKNQNFESLLKSSTGAGAIVARNAYQSQGVAPPAESPLVGARHRIRRRLRDLGDHS